MERKVQQVEQLFERLEKELAEFKDKTNLSCLAGCGNCCTTPSIEASPLEFFPWAHHLFVNDVAEQTLVDLQNKTSHLCHIFQPLALLDKTKGRCSDYPYRGLICRLFGYGAANDAFGKLRLITCKIIKENQADDYAKTVRAINAGQYVPIFSDYYMQLSQIDFALGRTMLPINEALKRALEEVLHYYAYRPLPKVLKNIA
jgi:hypothetical protein